MKQTNDLFTSSEKVIGRAEDLKLVTTEKFAGLDVDFYRNENNEIYMTRNQIGGALGYSNPQKAMDNIHARNKERLDQFSVTLKLGTTDGKAYNTHLYSEKGIYEIMRKSNQPKADEFYDFVYDVIEGLRKGELTIVSNTPSYMIEDPIARAEQWIVEQKEKLALEETINEYKPKVDYYDTILNSTDTLSITQIAKDYGLSGRRLNQLLNEEGIQYKIGGQWVLYQKYADKGYTRTHTHSYDREDGTTGANIQTKWTQRGRLLIHNILTDKGYIAEMDKEEEVE